MAPGPIKMQAKSIPVMERIVPNSAQSQHGIPNFQKSLGFLNISVLLTVDIFNSGDSDKFLRDVIKRQY